MGELIEEGLIIASNELRKLREQSGKSQEVDTQVVDTVGDLLRVLTYVKRNRDSDLEDEVNGLTTEELKERLRSTLETGDKQAKRAADRKEEP